MYIYEVSKYQLSSVQRKFNSLQFSSSDFSECSLRFSLGQRKFSANVLLGSDHLNTLR